MHGFREQAWMPRFAFILKWEDVWMDWHFQASWECHYCWSKDDSDVQLKRGHFYRSVNGLCYKFKGTLLNRDVATRLFQTCCCSFYGSQAWILSSSSFECICTAWNKAVRRIFHLLYNTPWYLLPYTVQTSHIGNQLVERFRTFFATCMSCKNLLINLLAPNTHFCNSPLSMNRKYV